MASAARLFASHCRALLASSCARICSLHLNDAAVFRARLVLRLQVPESSHHSHSLNLSSKHIPEQSAGPAGSSSSSSIGWIGDNHLSWRTVGVRCIVHPGSTSTMTKTHQFVGLAPPRGAGAFGGQANSLLHYALVPTHGECDVPRATRSGLIRAHTKPEPLEFFLTTRETLHNASSTLLHNVILSQCMQIYVLYGTHASILFTCTST